MLKAGAMFPTRELPARVDDLRQWVATVVECGFDHIIAADHVLGLDPAGGTAWADGWPHPLEFRKPYTVRDVFHEPMVLFGYLAALCDLELVTGVLVLPQRQAVLVAKQAAEVDVLTNGRLRLGVGVGWNRGEFEALGMPYDRRGALVEEQIAVMRALWCHETVDFVGEHHRLHAAGLQMLPIQQPIPVWIGGFAPRVLERTGRIADGWTCSAGEVPGDEFAAKVDAIREAAERAGRDPASIGVECRQIVLHDDAEFRARLDAWRSQPGVTHLAIDTMNVGRRTLEEHTDALRRAAAALDLTP